MWSPPRHPSLLPSFVLPFPGLESWTTLGQNAAKCSQHPFPCAFLSWTRAGEKRSEFLLSHGWCSTTTAKVNAAMAAMLPYPATGICPNIDYRMQLLGEALCLVEMHQASIQRNGIAMRLNCKWGIFFHLKLASANEFFMQHIGGGGGGCKLCFFYMQGNIEKQGLFPFSAVMPYRFLESIWIKDKGLYASLQLDWK